MVALKLSKKHWIAGLGALIGLILFCGGFVFYVQPGLDAQALGRMVLARNYPGIIRNMDFPALKVNMANNLFRIIRQNDQAHHMHLDMAVMKGAADNGAAHMATPEGVQALLRHTLPALGQHIAIVRYTGHFLSLNRYAVLVTGASGGHIGAVFYRSGLLHWKLGDIQMFPPHMPLTAYPAPASVASVEKQAPDIRPVQVPGKPGRRVG